MSSVYRSLNSYLLLSVHHFVNILSCLMNNFTLCGAFYSFCYGMDPLFSIEGRNATFDCHLVDGCLMDNHATFPIFYITYQVKSLFKRL